MREKLMGKMVVVVGALGERHKPILGRLTLQDKRNGCLVWRFSPRPQEESLKICEKVARQNLLSPLPSILNQSLAASQRGEKEMSSWLERRSWKFYMALTILNFLCALCNVSIDAPWVLIVLSISASILSGYVSLTEFFK